MHYFSMTLLCLMVFSLTACAGRTQQRQNELANQVTVADLNYRLEMLEQRLATVANELSVLKHHPYPVKTSKGAKTDFIASAPGMLAPQPYSAPAPPKQPQSAPAAQIKRPAAVNELAMPPETPAAPRQPVLAPLPPAAPQAASAPAPRGRQTSQPAMQNPAGQSEEAIYNKALAEFNAGRYAQAAAGFSELTYIYPTGRYAPHAGYWLGESLYGQNQDNDALVQFTELTSRFPQHPKAPEALFKAGLCYMRLGDTNNAAVQFRALVTDYPDSPAANLARQQGFIR